jgi:hypothetical protein
MSYFVTSDRELSAYLQWLRIRAELGGKSDALGND